MFSLSIPANYAWVLLAAVTATGPLNLYQVVLVARARRAAGIKYPQLYPTPEETAKDVKALKFGCIQRAHQNTLENITGFLFLLLSAGLNHPHVAAALGFTWIAGRVVKTVGYSSGNPAKRNMGGMNTIGGTSMLGLMGLSVYSAVTMVLATF